MCAVCIFHAWYKAKSDACGKPRLIQDTRFHTLESHNMRHLPLYWSSSTDIEVGFMDSRNRVAAGASGFLWASQCGAFFLALAGPSFRTSLKNLSTYDLRCCSITPSVFLCFLQRSNASLKVEASFGVTRSIKHCFGNLL